MDPEGRRTALRENPRYDFPPLRPPPESDRVPRGRTGEEDVGQGPRIIWLAWHTYLRVPSIARIVQNHALTIAGPQCTAQSRSENCVEERDERAPTMRETTRDFRGIRG